MTEKQEIIKRVMPLAVLKAMTPEARLAVSQILIVEGIVPLNRFPFRVGREMRVKIIDGRVERIERIRAENEWPNNDLYLVDDGVQFNVATEHFQIEKDGDAYYLYDRGSDTGTLVGERQVGAGGETTVALKDGDLVTIGTSKSPYVFQFIDLGDFELQPRR
jgi:pSer/pThr/pTyr-binding forkhead associated (FHA) protein